MRKTFLTILITAAISFGISAGLFWWFESPKLDNATALLNQVTHGSVTILNQFSAIDNLEGYVVQSTQNNAQTILYIDNRGRYLLSGTILDQNMQNISAQNYQTYIAPQSASTAFNYLANVSYIQQGSNSAPHQAYIVFDPNCIFCHRLFETLQPFIQNGSLAIRWVPVAFLKATSTGRAYAMLSSSNPEAVLIQNEKNFNEATEEGGIPPLSNPSAKVQQQLQNNMAFLTESQIQAAPAIFYKNASGIASMMPNITDPSKIAAVIQGFGASF